MLKEFALGKECYGQATLVLSKVSTDFECLQERAQASGIFEQVVEFDEKKSAYFPELDFFKKNQGNIIKNMVARIRFTKMFAKLQEPYIPVDFTRYKNIYVYCDSDPIGYYLNQNHIAYHAIEDGFNCLKLFNAARHDNKGFFPVKVWMSWLNLIFIQNGYGRYCLDMEVNDISVISHPCRKYRELPRTTLIDRLTEEEKECLLRVFVKDLELLQNLLDNVRESHGKMVVILTEPLCDEDTRKRIFTDIIAEYGEGATVVFKQHPIDRFPYDKEFPEHVVIDRSVPMELLNFMGEGIFDEAIAIFTQVDSITFAKKKIFLGSDFMDRYEEPHLHCFDA